MLDFVELYQLVTPINHHKDILQSIQQRQKRNSRLDCIQPQSEQIQTLAEFIKHVLPQVEQEAIRIYVIIGHQCILQGNEIVAGASKGNPRQILRFLISHTIGRTDAILMNN